MNERTPSAVTEYKIGRATVRIHGDFDMDRVKTATERLAKRTMRQKKEHIHKRTRT